MKWCMTMESAGLLRYVRDVGAVKAGSSVMRKCVLKWTTVLCHTHHQGNAVLCVQVCIVLDSDMVRPHVFSSPEQ
jgi:hypothetical protein